jgi:hypothetical protein
MRRLANLEFNPSTGVELASLLDLVRQADAKVEKDKVYSILGLLNPAISADVVPDYSLPVQQVFTDFMKAIIENTNSLDQILYGGIPCENDWRWPSWVPDLRLPFVRRHNQYLERRQASGDSPARFEFRKMNERSILVCDGFQVDTVDGTTGGSSPHRSSSQPRHASDRYKGQTSEALEQTLSMGHPAATKRVLFKIPWWSRMDQSSYSQRFQDFKEHNKAFRIGGKTFEDFFPRSGGQRMDTKVTLACIRLVMLSLDHRALITTNTGYLGLAPIAVRPGDVVAILLGCRCPVVLRPCDDEKMYQVVGECYVHGLMDGEILSQEHDGLVSEKQFVLC